MDNRFLCLRQLEQRCCNQRLKKAGVVDAMNHDTPADTPELNDPFASDYDQ